MPFTTYWTNLQRYENCPRYFLWSRGWEGIDLGRGDGKKKYPKVPKSRHHAVMGIAIGKGIEDLYEQELFRHPSKVRELVEQRVRRSFQIEINKTKKNWIDWRQSPQQSELLQTCIDGALGYLRTMQAQRFLGTWNRAEWEILGWVDKYTPVGGKVDVVFRHPKTGLTMLDGKNSTHKGKYTDPDQLRYYAMVYYLSTGKLPDRLGFVYYRFPYGFENEDGTVEEGVDWIDCTRGHIVALAKRVKEARKGMDKHLFDPNPVPSYCKWCEYESECPERQEQRKANAAKRGKRKDSLPILDDDSKMDKDGFFDLSLGGHDV
jgi:hypothetical protein